MSLVPQQAAFLLQVAELIQRAAELGLVVTGGELYRTPEQQALYVQAGRSATLDSQHLKRLAIDLNCFVTNPDGTLRLTYAADDLRPLGEFWESLDPANRWGGNWSSFKDTPHFERIVRAGHAQPTSAPEPTAGTYGRGLLTGPVGPRARNLRDDVETVQRLLNLANAPNGVPLNTDGLFGAKTASAIADYQRTQMHMSAADGRVDVNGQTLMSLCQHLSTHLNLTDRLALIYLHAADADLAEFGPLLGETCVAHQIDTPLRRAHFIAQIGHESGELRFRAEIASGQAYEGRADLGNTQSGDGKRFKGRGLIQLTGRANYASFGRYLGRESQLLAEPELVETDPALCVGVAGWYWETRGLNALADADDINAVTRRINGGLNGIEDRRRLLVRAKAVLGVA